MTEVTPEKTVTMGITHYRQLVADCDRMAKAAFEATVRAMKAENELEEAKITITALKNREDAAHVSSEIKEAKRSAQLRFERNLRTIRGVPEDVIKNLVKENFGVEET